MSIDLTLQRIETLLSHFEAYARPTIHIAGTNGKGSISALLTRMLMAAGLTVGRFNSPHLVTVLDSIAINDITVEKQLYETIRSEVEIANKGINASSFEVLTTTALLIFERQKVDLVVLEVGMGGRLDATNVIPDASVLVSVITSIDLDHTAFLGSTVQKIAYEKAGIIRPGRNVVLSSQQHKEVEKVVQEVCANKGASLISAPIAKDRQWDKEIDGPEPRPFALDPFNPPHPRPVEVEFDNEVYSLLLPLHGDHQLANLGSAMTVFRYLLTGQVVPNSIQQKLSALPHTALHEAIRLCRWPGRLSFHFYPTGTSTRNLNILADGAHNEEGARMLAAYVNNLLLSLSRSPNKSEIRITYVIGLSDSPPKTPSSIIIPLLSGTNEIDLNGIDLIQNAAFVQFTPPEGMPWVRPVHTSIMADIARQLNGTDGQLRQWNIWAEPEEQDVQDKNLVSPGLRQALDWITEEHQRYSVDGTEVRELVIIAGSLYLVADLYRLLEDSS